MSRTRQIKPLNVRQQSGAVENIQTWIQEQKVEISRVNLTKLQYRGRWPDEYDAFHTSLQKRNRYKDPAKFFRVMPKQPKLYAKKFIYTNTDDNIGIVMARAISDALSEALRQSRRYVMAPNVSGSANRRTGFYDANFKIGIGRGNVIASATQLQNLQKTDTVFLANVAEYAGSSEVNALFYANVGGILYYAAQRIKKKYKNLAVSFKYEPAGSIQGAYANKQIPVLRIAAKGVIDATIKTPGKNYRRRERRRGA